MNPVKMTKAELIKEVRSLRRNYALVSKVAKTRLEMLIRRDEATAHYRDLEKYAVCYFYHYVRYVLVLRVYSKDLWWDIFWENKAIDDNFWLERLADELQRWIVEFVKYSEKFVDLQEDLDNSNV